MSKLPGFLEQLKRTGLVTALPTSPTINEQIKKYGQTAIGAQWGQLEEFEFPNNKTFGQIRELT